MKVAGAAAEIGLDVPLTGSGLLDERGQAVELLGQSGFEKQAIGLGDGTARRKLEAAEVEKGGAEIEKTVNRPFAEGEETIAGLGSGSGLFLSEDITGDKIQSKYGKMHRGINVFQILVEILPMGQG
jgi:hypothetical protein